MKQNLGAYAFPGQNCITTLTEICNMPPRKKPVNELHSVMRVLAILVVPVLTFAGGMVINAWTIADKIATKPYVDERFETSIKHTDTVVESAIKHSDERTNEFLEKAISHSDKNRQDMSLEFTKMNSDNRETMAKVSTTLELLVHAVQGMRDEAYDEQKSRRRK